MASKKFAYVGKDCVACGCCVKVCLKMQFLYGKVFAQKWTIPNVWDVVNVKKNVLPARLF